MTTLADLLLAPGRREALVRETARWVERYVEQAGGLRGIALRAGLGAARAGRADIVPRAVARLLPEMIVALEPHWQRFKATGERDFGAYLQRHARDASESLMQVADARAEASGHRALAAGYRRLRGTLESELERLLPDIARMIGRTAKSTS
jgi:hypothetical protein